MQEDVRAARVEIESFVTSQQNTLITDSSPMKQSPGSHLATPNASAKGRRLGSISKSRQVDSECRAESQPPKTLTLKQLRSFIEEIYASKERYDDKCKQSNMPYETMEQHMYTYLNQRYGLKELVVEWATAIVNGVKKHAASANDVVVFGRILRNEIEEEFRFVQMKLRETAEELLLQQLKGRHPLKSDVELGRLLEKKKEKGLREEEWTYIVEYLYNADDAASLSSVVRKQLFLSHSSRPSGAKSDPLIPYDDFVVVLLNFQLANHQRFLEPLVSAFKSVDTDRNGIVDGAEFRRVVLCLREDALEEDINQLLRQIDPLGSQVIVFSRCVPVLANLLTE
ncbi:hypothetical protein, conserved [Angomonas deanei]|uniref:EF-hand domain-containing protein n=1 Tax=Angomonas deanei TaxID=59799 RepID=A0A7G2CD30_9TRYP|nr:hypothetical protein, conserved [Angomonas deanei]